MSARSGAIDFDRRTFRDAFDRRPFIVLHDLAGHPLCNSSSART